MLLHEKLRGRRLLLASQSPRRRQLLAEAGIPYEPAVRYEVEERWPAGLAAEEVPCYLSRLKSEGYPRPLGAGEILLTADTVVVLDGEVLGKPDGPDGAAAILRRLSGVCHRVVSGVTLRTAQAVHTFAATTDVRFRPLTDEEIDYYVAACRPFDKAGGYGIQEWIGYAAVERIEGSFYNVMGLPVQRLYVELEQLLDRE